jgi:hypothetical protein
MISWVITSLVIWGVVGGIIVSELFDAPSRPLVHWRASRLTLTLILLGPVGWLFGVMWMIVYLGEHIRELRRKV